MKVAWQFTARGCKKPNPSRRERYDWVGTNVPQRLNRNVPADQLRPYPPGRVFFKRIPGSKLPGYFHLVPPGQNPGQPCTFSTPYQGSLSTTTMTDSPPGFFKFL